MRELALSPSKRTSTTWLPSLASHLCVCACVRACVRVACACACVNLPPTPNHPKCSKVFKSVQKCELCALVCTHARARPPPSPPPPTHTQVERSLAAAAAGGGGGAEMEGKLRLRDQLREDLE